jgi:hypothetical protein
LELALHLDHANFYYTPMLLLVLGVIFFFAYRGYYRNAGQRYHHETDTQATIENVGTYDRLIEQRRRLDSSRTPGANETEVEGAVSQNRHLVG